MPNVCPTGWGALANVPELANDPFLARQPAVSGPKIDEMVLHDERPVGLDGARSHV